MDAINLLMRGLMDFDSVKNNLTQLGTYRIILYEVELKGYYLTDRSTSEYLRKDIYDKS